MTFLSDIPSEKLIKDLTHITNGNIENKSDKYNIIEKKFIFSCQMVMEELI